MCSSDLDNALHVKNVSFDLVKTVREQNPQVVKFDTFRVFEHCGPNIDDNLGYRSKEEIISYADRDPLNIIKLIDKVKERPLDWKNIDTQIKTEVMNAFERALLSPFAGNEEASNDVA